MTNKEALRLSIHRLEQCSVPDAAWDAALLLSFVTGKAPLELKANGWEELDDEAFIRFEQLIARREKREPLQYIIGNVPFMGVDIRVTPDALIPRMDTEVLCEKALSYMNGSEKVLDLCTGTGVIAITLKHAFEKAAVWAADISEKALALAGENAARNGTDIIFRQGDLFEAVGEERFDMIVSNPPYINAADMETLQEEVRREPRLALYGGEDGLDLYRRIVKAAPGHLNPGGRLLFEIGYDEGQAVSDLMEENFEAIAVHKDLNGLDRCVEGKLK